MKKVTTFWVLFLLFVGTTWAQDPASQFAETITQADLRAHLEVIAADSMEGRATATPGQKRAARYIENHFRSLNLEGPSAGENAYQQEFRLEERSWGRVYLETASETFTNLEDLFYVGDAEIEMGSEMEAVYVGRGTEQDLEGHDLTGKAAVIFAPGRGVAQEPIERCKEAGAAAYLVIYNDNQDDFMSFINTYKVYLSRPSLGFAQEGEEEGDALYYISPVIAKSIFGFDIEELVTLADGHETEQVPNVEISLAAVREVKELRSSNVVGFLEGKTTPEEVLVITAHYDHLGMGEGNEVYNGADDDGSGTVTVMELAEAFATAAEQGYQPNRSILFMLVSGEERGLLGSEYYTSNPIFPLENTITNLNIDMIGRMDEAHEDNPYFVYLIGSDKLSTELHELSEAANEKYTELDLDYRYNDENDPNRYYYRSDHYNFAKNNVPVVFYFNGTHEDYHRTSDTVDKIHFGKMERIGRLVFYTAWDLANRENRPALDAPVEEEKAEE